MSDEEEYQEYSSSDPLGSQKKSKSSSSIRDIKIFHNAGASTSSSSVLKKERVERYIKQANKMDLTYSKVIIPSNMRSRYWRYFGFPANNAGVIVSKEQIVCTLCNVPINFHKNTTNLRSHLLRHHGEEIDLESDTEEYRAVASIKKEQKKKLKNANNTTPQRKFTLYKKARMENTLKPTEIKRIKLSSPATNTNPLCETIANESELLNGGVSGDLGSEQITAEAIEYQEYSGGGCGDDDNDNNNSRITSVKLSSTTEVNLTEMIQQMIIIDLQPTSITEGIGFTNLIWALCGNIDVPKKKEIEESLTKFYEKKSSTLYETLQTHSATSPFSLSIEIWQNTEMKNFVTFYFNYIPKNSSKFHNVLFTAIELSKYTNFDEVFRGINLQNCSAAVVNTYNNIIASFLALYDIPSINCFDAVIQRCMKAAFKIPDVQSFFNEIQDLFHKHSDMLPNISLIPKIDDSYPWTKYNLIKYFYDNIAFQDEDDNELVLKSKTILECLHSLKMTIETLIDEPNALASLVKPLASKLVEQHFQPRAGEFELTAQIKDCIGKELKQSLLSNEFVIISTFLDPRFHSFIREDEIQLVYQNIKNKSIEISDKRLMTTVKTNDGGYAKPIKFKGEITTEGLISKRSSLKLFFDDGNQRIQSTSKVTLDQEITKYRTEVCADLEQCPLDWWSKMGYVYGQLKIIADEYKCVPCCINKNFRKTTEEQINFHNRRLMLKGEVMTQLLFLHYNKMYLD